MKILQVYPGKVWGGAEQLIHDLGAALEAEGHEVGYLCRHDSRAVIGRTQAHPFDFGPKWSLTAPGRLADEIDRQQADIVHIHDLRFVPVAVRAKRRASREVKVVFTRHIARGSRMMPWERGLMRDVDGYLFVSRLARDMFVGANSWLPAGKCHVVLNSVPQPPEVSDTERAGLKARLGIAPADTVMMFCGRVRKSKGVEVMLKALAPYARRQFKLIVAGTFRSDRFRRRFDELVSLGGLEDKVITTGFLNDTRIYESIADIGLAPSIVRESCGLSAMEFMAAGAAVVTTDNGAQKEYITDGETGILVKPGSVEQLGEAIGRLLDTPRLRHEIGLNASREYSRRLAYHIFVQRTLDVYRQLYHPQP